MPEGHTLHRLAKLHQRRYARKPVTVSSPQGRFALEAESIDGMVLQRAEAYGKHLFHRYDDRRIVHVHLGLYGAFTELENPAPEPVGKVRMRLTGETHTTDLRGPTKCELLNVLAVDRMLARLGPDPLRKDAKPELAHARIARSKTSIAALLMDQSVLAGVGNVYRAELLFRHGIPPYRPGREIDGELWSVLWADLVALMRDGVRVGRIDTVRPEHDPRVAGRAPRKDRHGGEVYVYRRAGMPCHVCGTSVAMAELAGRNLYWCPSCQAG
ncbi:Fpg/Nei family DNA glycosylase [Sciscionella sediminilitoris]|uniref:Fpg/Nei family DNA glycosylase n=1 Tax=Sciscionella sediminilitoris TaxID=1445613 RepID=UPI0004DF613A|nr:DNA-formamidopyrimidine glycosylase family protein [Sciscionella sp. SE31]